jgi:hypothetical protein
MSLLSVVKNVCAVVGVEQPTSVFSNINSNRTMQEMLSLANEMARRIAYDTREWQQLKKSWTFAGDAVPDPFTGVLGGTIAFDMPSSFQRLLKTTQVWRSTSTMHPMVFYPDFDEWQQRRAANYTDAWGEWTMYGGQMHIWPIMPAHTSAVWKNSRLYRAGDLAVDPDVGTVPYWLIWQCSVEHTTPATGTFADERLLNPSYWAQPAQDIDSVTARFSYLDRNCVLIHGTSARSDSFANDDDKFLLDERLLKLAMIWQWKAQKGSPYAEDMGNYATALDMVAGADTPAPIIIGRAAVSKSARVAYPWPPGWGP